MNDNREYLQSDTSKNNNSETNYIKHMSILENKNLNKYSPE